MAAPQGRLPPLPKETAAKDDTVKEDRSQRETTAAKGRLLRTLLRPRDDDRQAQLARRSPSAKPVAEERASSTSRWLRCEA